MTATRRPRAGKPMAAVRQALRALKYVNDELMRASEAIIRSARAPLPRPRAQAPEVSVTCTRPRHRTRRPGSLTRCPPGPYVPDDGARSDRSGGRRPAP